MLKFLDGPAAGVTLMLHRAPLLLRLVQAPDGTWDGLDQLADQPKPSESVHVYMMHEHHGRVHLRMARGAKGGSGFYEYADYKYLPEQPADDADVRDTERWRAWTLANAPRLMPNPPKRRK